ncbi:MAG: hypothetical protein V3575_06840 [Candidatus Absconditabacteria bacterium]
MIEIANNYEGFQYPNSSEKSNILGELTNEKLNIILTKLFQNIVDFDITNLSIEEKFKLYEGVRILKQSKDLGISFIKVLLFRKSFQLDGQDHILMNLDFTNLKSFLYKLVDTEFYHETLVLDSKLDVLSDICELRKSVASKGELNIFKQSL